MEILVNADDYGLTRALARATDIPDLVDADGDPVHSLVSLWRMHMLLEAS